MNRIASGLGALGVAALLTLTGCSSETGGTPTSPTAGQTSAPASTAPVESPPASVQAPDRSTAPATTDPKGGEKAYTLESLTALFESVQVGGAPLVAAPETNSAEAKKQIEDLMASLDQGTMTPADCVAPYKEAMSEFNVDTLWVIGSNEHSGQAMLRDVQSSESAKRTLEKTKAFVEKCPVYSMTMNVGGSAITSAMEQKLVDVDVPGLENAMAYVITAESVEQFFVLGSVGNVLVSATNFATSGPVDPGNSVTTAEALTKAVAADLG